MRRKMRAIARLGRRKGRHALKKMLGTDNLTSGYLTPELHENLCRLSQARRDLRL